MKNRNNKKGFTLVEVLVVVLIIGILAAIAVPSYNFAVEKTRAKQGIISLTQIAKAQYTYNAKKGNYSDNMLNLPLDMKDSDGSDATGAEFADKFFDYKIFGDEFERARATRNTGEYELSVEYETGQLFCRPIESQMCQKLGLAEGEEFVTWPQQEDCDPYVYTFSVHNGRTCRRTIFKDGTKQERVCLIGASRCYVFDNDGKQIHEMLKTNSSYQVYDYDPDTGEKTSWYFYDFDGNVTGYTKYENGVTVEFFGNNSSSLDIYNPDQTLYDMSYKSDGTPNMLQYVDRSSGSWKVLSRQYYGDDGKVSRLEYWDNYGVRAAVYYNSDGSINTSSTTCSRNCTGWEPPTRSSLQYGTAIARPSENYCDTHSYEDFICGE